MIVIGCLKVLFVPYLLHFRKRGNRYHGIDQISLDNIFRIFIVKSGLFFTLSLFFPLFLIFFIFFYMIEIKKVNLC